MPDYAITIYSLQKSINYLVSNKKKHKNKILVNLYANIKMC